MYLITFLIKPRAEKYFYFILGGCALTYFIVHIVVIKLLQFDPAWDLKAIYAGAIKWVETGTFDGLNGSNLHNDYFYIFPNNLGGMVFLAFIFKIANLLGLHNYFWIASIFNSFLICNTIVLASLIAKNILGKKAGIVTLCCFMLMPAFYFMAPVFYTDSLSIIFPMLALYLFTLAKKTPKLWLEIIIYFSSALVCALGALVKMPVLIVGIAICISLLCNKKFKKLLFYSILLIVCCSAVMGTFNGYVYSKHLDKKIAREKEVSILYWVDLAFTGDGNYNGDIFSMASDTSIPPETRKDMLKKDIKKKIKELNLDGIIKLFERKNAIIFGNGEMSLADFLDDSPKNSPKIHDFLLYNGKHYETYKLICTGVFMGMILCMLFTIKKAFKNDVLFAMLLSVFGIALFLLFWETNCRYITTFIPFIVTCSGMGIHQLYNKLTPKKIKQIIVKAKNINQTKQQTPANSTLKKELSNNEDKKLQSLPYITTKDS
ncbi:MAG: glycosyltransferase family 39 protein [Clostridia bacterium]|nr:glycosyltransferase family 39 protein [Clostridia bacterium]